MKLLSVMKLLITTGNTNMYKYKMKSHCLKCRKNTENINPKVSKTSNSRTILLIVQYVRVKNQDLLKIKRQNDC